MLSKRKQMVCAFCLPFFIVTGAHAAEKKEAVDESSYLLDQSIAVVGSELITLRDVKLKFLVISLLRDGAKIFKQAEGYLEEALFDEARDQEIQERLMLAYLKKLGLAKSLSSDKQNKLMEQFEVKVGSLDFIKKKLKNISFTFDEVQGEVFRQGLKITFIKEQLGFQLELTDADLQKYYQSYKQTEYEGKSFSAARPQVTADLKATKLRGVYLDWLKQRQREVDVQILPLQFPQIKRNLSSFLAQLTS